MNDVMPGFWRGLFDLRFRHFVTVRVVQVLYASWLVLLVVAVSGGVGIAWGRFSGPVVAAIGVGAVVAALFLAVMARVALEAGVVFVRILEELRISNRMIAVLPAARGAFH